MLTTQTLHTLHRALLDAFGDPYDFEHLLRSRLGLRPELLTVSNSPMFTRVFEVLQTAEQAGWTHDLVRAAYEVRPHHQGLATIYQDLGLATDVSVQHAGTAMAEAPTMPTAEGFERIFPSAAAIDIGVWREQLSMIEARVCRMEVGGGEQNRDRISRRPRRGAYLLSRRQRRHRGPAVAGDSTIPVRLP